MPPQNEPLPGETRNHAQLLKRLESLQELSILLISQHDVSVLLNQIVERAVDLLECDAGSLYLCSDAENLFFEVAVNRSVSVPFQKTRVDLRTKSLAGFVFRTHTLLNVADAYNTAPDSPFELNTDFDNKIGYRTRSLLAVPLLTKDNQALGVLQLINKKHSVDETWPPPGDPRLDAMPCFDSHDEQLLRSYAALASASLENAKLYKNIADLMDGFVTASVSVIESRDKTTRGHSERVAVLSTGVAQLCASGGQVVKSFTPKQINELRYAALLHDFGKIAVPEATLLKRDKLHEEQKNRIYARIQDFKAAAEIGMLRKYLRDCVSFQQIPSAEDLEALDVLIRGSRRDFDDIWQLVSDLTKPAVVVKEVEAHHLKKLSQIHCQTCSGQHESLLSSEELQLLSIPKGSLSEEERRAIESHVQHTFSFLRRIPWTPDLAQVPHIAHAHHEKQDGTGYPQGLRDDEIPHPARILTICDIFDALVARDRPYKPALPLEKALGILESEVKQGKIDAHYFRVFLEGRVYENQGFLDLLENKQGSLHFENITQNNSWYTKAS